MRSAVLLLALGAVTACGSASTAPPAAVDPPAAGAAKSCEPPPGDWMEGRDPPAYCVEQVTGKLVDAASKPLAGVSVSVCGRACFSGGTTDDTGAFHVPVSSHLPDGGYVFFVHARPRHASLLIPLPKAPPERLVLADAIEIASLSDESAALPANDAAASTISIGPLTLGVPSGTSWELALEDELDASEGRRVRFAKVPVDRAPPFASGAALVYALAPFEAKASKPLSLTVSETGGLAAGSAVEMVVMGDFSIEEPNTGGLPQVVAKGHVSADGKSIASDPGEGIQLLTWVAIRAAR